MQALEKDIFEGYAPQQDCLLAFGFEKQSDDDYLFRSPLSKEGFECEIAISALGEVEGRIFEEGELYTTYRFPGAKGFALEIKEEYISLLEQIRRRCFQSSREPDYYLVPSNPKMYDVDEGFRRYGGVLGWPSKRKLKVGDIVFIYRSRPFMGLRHRCVVEDANGSETYDGKVYSIIRIRLVETYAEGEYPLSWLQENGLMTVRFTHKMKKETAKAILEKKNGE